MDEWWELHPDSMPLLAGYVRVCQEREQPIHLVIDPRMLQGVIALRWRDDQVLREVRRRVHPEDVKHVLWEIMDMRRMMERAIALSAMPSSGT